MLLLFAPTICAGAASAAVDLYFTSLWKQLFLGILALGLATTCEARFYLPTFFRYCCGLVIWTDSITEFTGTIYAIKIFLQICRYVQGYDTDDSFLEHATVAEYNLIAYFFSNGVIRILWILWNFKALVTITAISVGFVWKLLPENGKDYVVQHVVQHVLITLVLGLKSVNWESCSIRAVFIAFYEPMMDRLSRWEKAVVQEQQKGAPPLGKYKYESLCNHPERSIRLLKLDWRIRFSEITCSLSTYQLDTAPEYEAVSYRWGTLPPTIPLNIDGKALLIMPSVERFLWHSRSFVEPKYFWIDSICINQKEDEEDEGNEGNKEKATQILLMQDIYARASRVIVWLDAPTRPTYINDLRFALRFLANEAFTGYDTMNVFQSHFGTERENAPFQALHQFFSHDWFERIWVIQEVAMGKVIYVKYGGMCINWPCVERAVQTIMSNRVVFGQLGPSAIASYEMYAKPTESLTDEIHSSFLPNVLIMSKFRSRVLNKLPTSLARVLYITKSAFTSKRPEDKIFGVLGISTASELPFIPDYSKTAEEIFEEITRILLREQDWHLTLSSAGRGYPSGKLAPSLPSWVPDFHGPTFSSSGFANFRGPKEDALSSDPNGGVQLTPDPHIISVQCVKFDVLAHIGPDAIFESPTRGVYHAIATAMEANDTEAYFTLLRGKTSGPWYISSRELARKYSSAAKTSQAFSDEEFWATCVSESVDKSPEYLKESKEAWENFFLSSYDDFLEIAGRMENGKIARVMKGNFSSTVTGKAFAVTSKGGMALVPPHARLGDVCVWIRGALMPFVLRNGNKRRFEIVGTCYVHGVNDVYTEEEDKWEKIFLE